MDRQYGFAMDLNTDQTLGYNVQTDELLNQKNSVYFGIWFPVILLPLNVT